MKLLVALVCLTLLTSVLGMKSPSGFRPNFGGPSKSFQRVRKANSKCPRTNPIQNERLVREFYQLALGDKVSDRDTLLKFVAEDYIQHNPFAADGIDGLITAINGPFQVIPNFTLKYRHVIAAGDYVVTHLPIQFGTDISAVIDIFRIECGKIKEHWDSVQNTAGVQSLNSHPFF